MKVGSVRFRVRVREQEQQQISIGLILQAEESKKYMLCV